MRIVLALGGNALLARGQALTAENQRDNIRKAAASIASIAKDNEIIIVHGNGPQVGLLMEQNAAYQEYSPETTPYPMDVLGSQTCGMVGYMLQQELRNIDTELSVATLITQTVVNREDSAFANPTKFVGPVYTQESATEIMQTSDKIFKEDGQYYRRVVPSPKPTDIVELKQIETLVKADNVVIACGGGGVPVCFENGTSSGVECVIDKDLTAELLAEKINADLFIILTDGSVYKNYGKEDQAEMRRATPAGLSEFNFPAGSMGPKIDAVCQFVNSGRGNAAIGSLFELDKIIVNEAGTLITQGEGIIYY
ncbi:carbamate kinase [Photobacterium damselae]|nr:carbamate kinase [Photobacterium damselae]NVO62660.1 carbamate kinase [Photobacterium damselae subsp. damselae]NVO75776.1 carbamate kinase [Photobacterium damselae subsp. damselae]SPY29981.1 Carbamate kinase 1 [Photobacterium damselae]